MTKKKIDEKKINGKIHKKIAKKWRKFVFVITVTVVFEFPVLFDIKQKTKKVRKITQILMV